jgi:hypothetical protein
MRAISLMVQNSIKEMGSADDFLGHISPTDFVVVLSPPAVQGFQLRVRAKLEQSLDYFYPIKDREQATKSSKRLSVKISEVPSAFGRYSTVGQLKKDLLSKH